MKTLSFGKGELHKKKKTFRQGDKGQTLSADLSINFCYNITKTGVDNMKIALIAHDRKNINDQTSNRL